MIGFLIGAVLGGTVGVTAMCMCSVASEADRHMNEDSDRRIRDDIK